jgi:predicted nucleotidyltransferase component of viral defense system
MLEHRDLRRAASVFGAADDQIRRDHLVSHVLHGLADLGELETTRVVFFGGTALSRTHIVKGRLSEDVDLYASDRQAAAEAITLGLPRVLRREFPSLRWEPSLHDIQDSAWAVLHAGGGISVRVQLLGADRTYEAWPTERMTLHERYSDVPATTMRVPTRAAFVAMKTSAWRDRRVARDLYDLYLLAERAAIDTIAGDLLKQVTGVGVLPQDFTTLPGDLAWEHQLAHQLRSLAPAVQCLRRVYEAWAGALGW